MVRCLKVFFYTMTHDIAFFAIAILLLFAVMLRYDVNAFKNHFTIDEENYQTYVEYEKEDPELIVKTSNDGGSYYPHEPVNGSLAYNNSQEVSILLINGFCLVFFAVTIYQAFFFGRLYRNGAIKNLVIAGISKVKVFISAFILSELLILLFALLAAGSIALLNAVLGGYMIIYLPSFMLTVLAGFLILSFLSVFTLCIVFLSQNQLISLILPVVLALLTGASLTAILMLQASARPYEEDQGKVAEMIMGDKEYYFDTYTGGRDLYVEGKYVDIYDPGKPNKDYPGDTVHGIFDAAFKGDVMAMPVMLATFEYHPLVRDGVMTGYIVMSSCYTVIFFAAGCIIARKRNLN